MTYIAELHDCHVLLRPAVDALRTTAIALSTRSVDEVRRLVTFDAMFIATQLLAHTSAEEEVLCPSVCQAANSSDALAEMQRDHLQIRKLASDLAEIELELRGADAISMDLAARIRRVLYGLYALILCHFEKEEEVYHPLLRRALTPEATASLVKRLAASTKRHSSVAIAAASLGEPDVLRLDPHRSLSDIVAAQPNAAAVLDRLGLDYCCHGEHTLDDACRAAGVDLATVIGALDVLRPHPGGATAMSPPELADDIVATHHRYLRDELPLLDALAAKVLTVHGERHPELVDVRRLVTELRADLEPHLDKEERCLFPAIHDLFAGDRDFPFGSITNPIRVMTAEHDRAGELLTDLRACTGGYRPPGDACASYRSLYERLAALEHDTHVHVHKENHLLFPAAVAKELER